MNFIKFFSACFFTCFFVLNVNGQEDRFYACSQNLAVIDNNLEKHNRLIFNILTSEIGDNYIFRYLESCKGNTPEYGFQLHLSETNEYYVKSFRFSSSAWSAIWGDKNTGELKLITESTKISQDLSFYLLKVLKVFFDERDTISSGPIYFDAPCYNFYIQQENTLLCGMVTLPGVKTLELINILDLISNLPCNFNEEDLVIRLENLLIELVGY